MKVVLTALYILFSYHAHAETSVNDLYRLTESVREIILASPGGHPMPHQEFKLDTKASDQMHALSKLDEELRIQMEIRKQYKDCDKFNLEKFIEDKVNLRKFEIKAIVVANSTKFESLAVGKYEKNDYILLMDSLYEKGNYRAASIYTPAFLEMQLKYVHPEVDLDKLSFLDKEKKLSDFAEEWLGEKLPANLILNEFTYQTMVDRPQDWKSILHDVKDKLTSQQKIQLVSRLGDVFSDRYNYERRDAGDKARGEFWDAQELLQSAKDFSKGGICRDIALAQVQFLQELGFKNNYVVVYKDNGGRHANVISTDPVTGKIIKFNYADVGESPKGSTTEALNQNNTLPNHGLNFYIYDTDGKPVTRVSSDLSIILKDTSNADMSRDFSPHNYSISKVQISGDGVNGNIFVGRTSAGENIYGLAFFKDYNPNEYVKLSGGVSASHLEGQNSVVKIDQTMLYGRLAGELSSPKLKLGVNSASAFVGVAGDAILSNNRDTALDGHFDKKANAQFDGTIDLYAGVKNTTKLSDKTELENKVYINMYPDWSHVASGEHIIAHTDSVVLRSSITHHIDEGTKAAIDTAIVLKNYGNSMVVRGSFEDEKRAMSYSVGASVPLSSNIPTFLPGGERRAFASIEKKKDNFTLTIEYEKNFENKANSLNVKAKVKF